MQSSSLATQEVAGGSRETQGNLSQTTPGAIPVSRGCQVDLVYPSVLQPGMEIVLAKDTKHFFFFDRGMIFNMSNREELLSTVRTNKELLKPLWRWSNASCEARGPDGTRRLHPNSKVGLRWDDVYAELGA